MIQGKIDKALQACIEALNLNEVTTVIVNSGGGDVDVAMSVGDLLAPLKPHFIIKKHCHSSCANYWLPLARKITFKKKSRILLHGGFDPAILKIYEEKGTTDVGLLQRLVSKQESYTERHAVPLGWLLYRTDHSLENRFAPYLTGEPSKLNNDIAIKSYMVTSPMLRSCLPEIEVIGFEKSYAATRSEKKLKKLAKNAIATTGSWECQ